jgi:hypothetical protein
LRAAPACCGHGTHWTRRRTRRLRQGRQLLSPLSQAHSGGAPTILVDELHACAQECQAATGCQGWRFAPPCQSAPRAPTAGLIAVRQKPASALRTGEGLPLPARLCAELEREYACLNLVETQLRAAKLNETLRTRKTHPSNANATCSFNCAASAQPARRFSPERFSDAISPTGGKWPPISA